jgi:hypothetical protein
MRGVACMVPILVKRYRTEEPDAGNLHVRDLWGGRRVTGAFTRMWDGEDHAAPQLGVITIYI